MSAGSLKSLRGPSFQVLKVGFFCIITDIYLTKCLHPLNDKGENYMLLEKDSSACRIDEVRNGSEIDEVRNGLIP